MWFVLGLVVGFVLGVYGITRKIVGKLKYTIDDGDLYFFMELPNPDVSKILSQRFVILEVDAKPSQQ